jgi:hypothetical protein
VPMMATRMPVRVSIAVLIVGFMLLMSPTSSYTTSKGNARTKDSQKTVKRRERALFGVHTVMTCLIASLVADTRAEHPKTSSRAAAAAGKVEHLYLKTRVLC